MKKLIVILLAFASGLMLAFRTPGDEYIQKGLEMISVEKMISWVDYFSSDDCDGRLPGTPGYSKATHLTDSLFESWGLTSLGDIGYYQLLPVETNTIDNCSFGIKKRNKIKILELGEDFICRGFSGSGNFVAPLSFCGYGITDSKNAYDDYAGIDVTGRIVVVFKQRPRWKLNGENMPAPSIRELASNARAHGAKGILLLSRPNDKYPQKLIGSMMHGNGVQLTDFPQMQISQEVAVELFKKSGYSPSEAQSRIDSLKKPFPFHLNSVVEMVVESTYSKARKSWNVAGMLMGDDPDLRNEYIVIGAHIDHVGSQAGKVLFPGANDNASGSAAVMELARVFSEGKIPHKRSLVFVLFTAEEQGLKGAKSFIKKGRIPTEKITAMINMDCVACGDSIRVGCGKSNPELYSIPVKMDAQYTKTLIDRTWKGGGADATPFHEKGIPCLYFVSTNGYKYLHRAGDKTPTLNHELYKKLVKLAFLTVYEAAGDNYSKEKLIK